MIVVSNSSPLILLSAIGRLDLLYLLYREINIPEVVYQEIVSQGEGRHGEAEVNNATWIHRKHITDREKVSRIMLDVRIDEGESEAIVLAQELKADWLIIDDMKARVYAQTLGQQIIGVLGILLAAKANGFIKEIKQTMDDLLKVKYYISPALYKKVLQSAGE